MDDKGIYKEQLYSFKEKQKKSTLHAKHCKPCALEHHQDIVNQAVQST